MSLTFTTSHRAARNAASIVRADAGAGYSSIKVYTAQAGTLLGSRQLARPCGSVRASDGRLVLAQGTDTDVVAVTGSARHAEWCDASGDMIAFGRVTDPAGNYTDGSGNVVADPLGVGEFVLGGSGGPVGGTMVYAGGLVLLNLGVVG